MPTPVGTASAVTAADSSNECATAVPNPGSVSSWPSLPRPSSQLVRVSMINGTITTMAAEMISTDQPAQISRRSPDCRH
jgi:hypothetical protein